PADRRGRLVGPPDTEPASRGRVQPGDGLPAEPYLPGGRREITGDQAEQAGLSRAIRADDTHDVTSANGQRQLVRDDDLAEAFGDRLELQQDPRRCLRHPLPQTSAASDIRCLRHCPAHELGGSTSPPIGTLGFSELSTTTISNGY